MKLWDWAVDAYGAPGVSEACLALQDSHEQNVPLLLWAAWTATTGRRPVPEDIEGACDISRAWEETTVAPLRTVRRALKGPHPDMDSDAREAVRRQIKAVELEAERRLLEALEALAPAAPNGASRPALDAMVETARAWSRVTPRPALARLAEALPA